MLDTEWSRFGWSLPHDVVVFTTIVESADHIKAPGVLCHDCGGDSDHPNRFPNWVEHEVPTNVSAYVEGVAIYDPDAHEGRTFTEKPVKCGVDVLWPGFTKLAGSTDLVIGYCFRVRA